jgi:hypothetical protein
MFFADLFPQTLKLSKWTSLFPFRLAIMNSSNAEAIALLASQGNLIATIASMM